MLFEDCGCFRLSGSKWTEKEVVCARAGDRVGPPCEEEEVGGGEPVVFGWGLR